MDSIPSIRPVNPPTGLNRPENGSPATFMNQVARNFIQPEPIMKSAGGFNIDARTYSPDSEQNFRGTILAVFKRENCDFHTMINIPSLNTACIKIAEESYKDRVYTEDGKLSKEATAKVEDMLLNYFRVASRPGSSNSITTDCFLKFEEFVEKFAIAGVKANDPAHFTTTQVVSYKKTEPYEMNALNVFGRMQIVNIFDAPFPIEPRMNLWLIYKQVPLSYVSQSSGNTKGDANDFRMTNVIIPYVSRDGLPPHTCMDQELYQNEKQPPLYSINYKVKDKEGIIEMKRGHAVLLGCSHFRYPHVSNNKPYEDRTKLTFMSQTDYAKNKQLLDIFVFVQPRNY